MIPFLGGWLGSDGLPLLQRYRLAGESYVLLLVEVGETWHQVSVFAFGFLYWVFDTSMKGKRGGTLVCNLLQDLEILGQTLMRERIKNSA